MSNSAPGFLERNHFALRRLHSLTGIVPIGAFLLNHLLTNSTAFLGSDHFDAHVEWINDLPWLLAIEILFIFTPLAFHGILGIAIAWQGRLNATQYPYLDNWRYTLQRVTAWITIVFVLVHLAHFRFANWFGGEEYKLARPDFFDFTQQGFLHLWLPTWLWMVIYASGLSAAVYHLCNGLVTFCITWGLVIGVPSRKRVSMAAGALGVVLMIWGVTSLYALTSMRSATRSHVAGATPVEVRLAPPAIVPGHG